MSTIDIGKFDKDKVFSIITVEMTNIMKGIQDEVLSKIKDRTPVSTGTLNSSWILNNNIISNDTPYAGYVEEGTYKMPGAHMVQQTIAELPTIINNQLKD